MGAKDMNKDEVLTLLEGVKEEAKEKYKTEIVA